MDIHITIQDLPFDSDELFKTDETLHSLKDSMVTVVFGTVHSYPKKKANKTTVFR